MIINILFENNLFEINRESTKITITRDAKVVSSKEFIFLLMETESTDIVSNNVPKNTKSTDEKDTDIYRKSFVIENVINNYILGINAKQE